MFSPKATMFVILVLALMIIAPFVSAQETKQAEREAMYYRYLEFGSYVKGGSITPHWMADGSSFWYAEGAPANTVIWKVDPKANTKTQLFDTRRLRGAIAKAVGNEPDGHGVPFREFEFLAGETRARFRLGQREFILDLTGYRISEDFAAVNERKRVRPRVVGQGFNGDILEVLSPDRFRRKVICAVKPTSKELSIAATTPLTPARSPVSRLVLQQMCQGLIARKC